MICSNRLIAIKYHSKYYLIRKLSIKLQSVKRIKLTNNSIDDFNRIFNDQLPVVINGLIDDWPAINNKERSWSNLTALSERLKDVKVSCEFGGTYMNESAIIPIIDMSSFINHCIDNNSDIVHIPDDNNHIFIAQQNLLNTLENDVVVPKMCSLTGQGHLYKSNMWFGGPFGSSSPCHYDPFNNLLCQVVKSKRVLLFHPEESSKLYLATNKLQKNTSLINFTNPNVNVHPQYNDLIGYEVVLQPSEVLYIPYKWWHFCESKNTSFSVNFWWL